MSFIMTAGQWGKIGTWLELCKIGWQFRKHPIQNKRVLSIWGLVDNY